MKYISFAIPCYNSQDYMAHAIESILPGGDEVEIIIVNDGSKDKTSQIAHEYMDKYPDIIKVIDKRMEGMATRSTPDLPMPVESILRLWTVMTGWMRRRCIRY